MPALPSTSFNSSQLIQQLASLGIAGVADVTDSGQTFAERLSHWLAWTDAISLSRALNGDRAPQPTVAPPGVPLRAASVTEEFKRVRNDLAQSITTDTVLCSGGPPEESGGFSALRRHHLSHQRAMEARIGPLRAKARAALSAHSAELGALAELDAVLGEALVTRERHLLSNVPLWLEQHFVRSQRVKHESAPSSHTPATPGQQVQSVLLAELDIRLQPIEGLIEALAEHATNKNTTRPA